MLPCRGGEGEREKRRFAEFPLAMVAEEDDEALHTYPQC